MKELTLEEEYLKRIAELKWRKGYKCRKCKHKEYYQISKKYSRRCKNKECNYEESAIFRTGFEGCKLPVTRLMAILNDVQVYYLTYGTRISILELEDLNSVNRNTITLFFDKISKWTARRNFGFHAPKMFLEGLDSKEEKKYISLFALVIKNEFMNYPYSPDEMIYKMVTKLFPTEKKVFIEGVGWSWEMES